MRFVLKSVSTLILFGVILGLQASELPNFTTLLKEVGPAVVNISTQKQTTKKLISDELRSEIEKTPLMNILRDLYGNKLEEKLSGNISGIGSGSIISKNGFIVTNYHVVSDAQKIYVRLNDTREFPATLIGKDEGTDVALLKIDAHNLPTVQFAAEDNTQVGQWVVAIGSPFGFEHTATAGIISAKGRSLISERYVPFLQTDVAINPGNSGGPLFNLKGEMIGMNSQILTESGSFSGISFSIPVAVVKSVVDQIQRHGSVTRGWMGLAFQDITRELATSFGLKEVRGALVSKVIEGSPAEKAGFQSGDVIVSFNNKKVVRATDIPPMVGILPIHSAVSIGVYRDQKMTELNLIIGDTKERLHSSQVQYRSKKMQNVDQHVSEIKVRSLENNESMYLIEGGVVVLDVTGKNWLDAGLRAGDVILAVGKSKVTSSSMFYKTLKSLAGQVAPVLFTREGEIQRFTAVKFD